MSVRTSGSKTPEQLLKLKAKENWFKLVVKIISWKEGNMENGSVQQGIKITSKEWNAYTKGMLANNLIHGKQSVMDALKATKQKIMEFDGFESNSV